ncbi:hypothetical protein [Paenibacillus odorifer]|uniref:hypothetical protein n=1 Tax=Paenibacillus odorifer TaxID=189426 RepID=UPI001C4C5557|nr:hypothetical protein [Paenibacillus odorifer]
MVHLVMSDPEFVYMKNLFEILLITEKMPSGSIMDTEFLDFVKSINASLKTKY